MNLKPSLLILSILFLSIGTIAKHEVEFAPHCDGLDRAKGLTRLKLETKKVIGKLKGNIVRLPKAEYDSLRERCSIALQDQNPVLTGLNDKGSVTAVGSLEDHKAYLEAHERSKNIKRDPNKTMVLFFHGTCSNPDENPEVFRDKELLTRLKHELREQGWDENKDFMSIHGVGSGNKQVTRLHKFFFATDSYSSGRGAVTGGGTEENVRHALMHLNGITENPALEGRMAELIPHLKSIGRVIVIGWSRGGVTAIQFTRDLYKDKELGLKDVKVNLMLIDPVPGFGNISFGGWKHIHHLYPNVENSVAIYAEDEFSSGFTAIIPREVNKKGTPKEKGSRQVVMELPGNHATLVGNLNFKDRSKGEIEVFASSARIVNALAQTFIAQFTGMLPGVRYFPNGGFISLEEVSQNLNDDFNAILVELDSNDNQYFKLRSESYLGKTQTFGNGRKYHEEWELGLQPLTAVARAILPRYQADSLNGFHIKSNYDNTKKRNYVNHLHLMTLNDPSFDIRDILNAKNYYQQRDNLINKLGK